MKVLLFGATGMVGQGVLLECLADPGVLLVLAVGRTPSGQKHAKLRELILTDMADCSPLEAQVQGFQACFFCLGVSSSGMSEEQYHRVTYDLTMAAAETLAKANPSLTFCYVSGAGTDSTEHGPTMWARVKGKTENALLRLPFKAAFMFRPAYIQPLKGVRSKTTLYRVLYAIVGSLHPLWKLLFPNSVTSTVNVGRAMIHVVQRGYPRPILESRDINALSLEEGSKTGS
jgi:uncharacterized protein YbjT (DUF2867 family)